MKSIHRVAVAIGASALFSFATQTQAADTLAPSAPSSLESVSRTCNSIDLTWVGSLEPEADEAQSGIERYEIRNTVNNARIYSGTGASGSAPWTYLENRGSYFARYARITGLRPGAVYEFSITAVDRSGNRSAARTFPLVNVLNGAARCADVTPPSVPDIQASTFVAPNCHEIVGQIAPSTDAASGIEGYFVYLDGIRSDFPRRGVLSSHLRGLTPGREYKLALQAVDGAGNQSAISSQVALRMPACTAPLSGLLNVWAQGFHFKGEAVPTYDPVSTIKTVLFDADGKNLTNPFNVDGYLREVSFGTLGLKEPTVLVRWTQLPRTAAEYQCTHRDGLFTGCDTFAIAADARVAHPLHATLERTFPLRVYFVQQLSGNLSSPSTNAYVVSGITTDVGATSVIAATPIRNALTQHYPSGMTFRCPGPGTGTPDGYGNVPAYSQDAVFGCSHEVVDLSVEIDEWSRRMPHPAALWKYWQGWMPESETARVTAPFSGYIGAVDRKHTADKLLLIPVATAGTSGSANTPSYSVEYVSGTGRNAGQTTGLAIRYFGDVATQGGGGWLKRIDTLKPGESFVDPYRGIKIELVRTVSNLLAQVRVCNTATGVAADGSFSSVCIN